MPATLPLAGDRHAREWLAKVLGLESPMRVGMPERGWHVEPEPGNALSLEERAARLDAAILAEFDRRGEIVDDGSVEWAEAEVRKRHLALTDATSVPTN